MKRFALAPVMAAVLALSAGRAEAGLTLCNRTSYVIYAASAALGDSGVTVNGWTRLVPGGCAEAIKGDLTAHQYFVTAKTSRAHAGAPKAWNGPVHLCAKDKNFIVHTTVGGRCNNGAYETGFAEVSTQHLRAWTSTFHDSPDYSTMPVAERAGLKRLIGDAGFKNIFTDKQLDGALAAFKTRVHLAKTAPTAALFDALETEAMKTSVPAGYTLCNDTGNEFYAAIGLQVGGTAQKPVFAARGWWTVPGGTCAPLLTDSVAGKKIWLRVERGKSMLVQGPVKFCTTNIEFEVQGRERCSQRGLSETGFAETAGSPAAGYTAHVTASGLAGK